MEIYQTFVCRTIKKHMPNQNFRVGGRCHDVQTRLARYVALTSVELDPDVKVIVCNVYTRLHHGQCDDQHRSPLTLTQHQEVGDVAKRLQHVYCNVKFRSPRKLVYQIFKTIFNK